MKRYKIIVLAIVVMTAVMPLFAAEEDAPAYVREVAAYLQRLGWSEQAALQLQFQAREMNWEGFRQADAAPVALALDFALHYARRSGGELDTQTQAELMWQVAAGAGEMKRLGYDPEFIRDVMLTCTRDVLAEQLQSRDQDQLQDRDRVKLHISADSLSEAMKQELRLTVRNQERQRVGSGWSDPAAGMSGHGNSTGSGPRDGSGPGVR